jgi:acetate kinase
MTNKLYRILTINSGSSSIKFSLYQMRRTEGKTLTGQIERIGQSGGFFYAKGIDGKSLIEQHLDLLDHSVALKVLLEWLKGNALGQDLDAVGHRVVHGGSKYTYPQLITQELLTELRRLSPFAPEHLPRELDAIGAVRRFYPTVKQVACFDTAFHRSMPQVAQIYSLPRYLWDEGVLRYGFHGLSYEYIVGELAQKMGSDVANGRIIIAHLGHGSSMAAVHNEKGIDTTMGFTPTGGLVMSTRSGDLDPGVILYLLEEKGLTISQVKEIVNRKAGLLGVSGTSSDMKDLLEQENEDPRANLAIELFCYQAKKFLGALVAILGGLDTLVFTGGIGENAPAVRWRICDGLVGELIYRVRVQTLYCRGI